MTLQNDGYLTVAQAAERYHCSKSKLYSLLQRGRFPGSKWGGSWLIDTGEADKHLGKYSNAVKIRR